MRLSLRIKRSPYKSISSTNKDDVGDFEPLLNSSDSLIGSRLSSGDDGVEKGRCSNGSGVVEDHLRAGNGKPGSSSDYEGPIVPTTGTEVNGILKLLVLKLDGTSFDLSVPCSATVGEMKSILQTTVSELEINTLGYCDIHWDQVWSNFCLCYMNQKLLDDGTSLRALGIHSDDQVEFLRHKNNDYEQHTRKKKTFM